MERVRLLREQGRTPKQIARALGVRPAEAGRLVRAAAILAQAAAPEPALVACRYRYGRVSVCGYLADVYCLGVKNALGPEIMDDPDLRRFIRKYFSGYRGDPIEAPIELAREVV